ncbi:hypothetical protein PSP6_860001 [Paraburkholderia tropica]|nr:hypothetical protein PSP6_860001 [Paraburkholderia tropica]
MMYPGTIRRRLAAGWSCALYIVWRRKSASLFLRNRHAEPKNPYPPESFRLPPDRPVGC